MKNNLSLITIAGILIFFTSCKESANQQIEKFASLISVTGKVSDYSLTLKNFTKEERELMEFADELAGLAADEGLVRGRNAEHYKNIKESELTFTLNFNNQFNKEIDHIFIQLFTSNGENEKNILSSYEISKDRKTNFDGTETFSVYQSSGALHELIENSLIDYVYEKDKCKEIMSKLIGVEITKIVFADYSTIEKK